MDNGSAWAITVIVETFPEYFQYLGTYGGNVDVDSDSPEYMGPTSATNYAAELSAFTMACY